MHAYEMHAYPFHKQHLVQPLVEFAFPGNHLKFRGQPPGWESAFLGNRPPRLHEVMLHAGDKVHACETHAHETHAHEMHAHKTHAHETHA